VNAAVCEKKQKLHYFVKGVMSGIYEFASHKFREYWWKGITLDSPEVNEINCAPMMDVLAENHVETNYFDFFFGAELTSSKII